MQHAIILGAGVAGLTAASTLKDRGWAVSVLEASDRVGGRTFTKKVEEHFEEQGAEFVHCDHHPRLMAALHRHEIAIQALPDTGTTWHWQGVAAAANPLDPRLQSLLARIDEDLNLIDPTCWITEHNQHLDRPFRDYLNTIEPSAAIREMLLAWTGTLTGADPEAFSTLGILRDFKMFGSAKTALEAEEHRIIGGTQSLAIALAAPLAANIQFLQRAVSVRRQPSGLDVITADDQVNSADAVIVTMPFNTLHALDLPFMPDPSLSQASQRGHANRSAKHWFDPTKPFDSRISASPTTLAFMDVSQTSGCIIKDDHISTQTAAQALGLPDPKQQSTRAHAWTSDVNAQGAWMTLRPGQAAVVDAAWALGATDPTFQIANADVSPVWSGWVEGALYAGDCAAQRLLGD
jgi:monoamine oxidase